VVAAMIKFFYLCDYSDLAKDNPDAMLLHVRVYCLAHKYEIDALKSIAVKLFQGAASADLSIEKFPAVIREIYENTDESDTTLREAAAKAAIKNREQLLEDKAGEFSRTMAEVGECGRDVFRATSIMKHKKEPSWKVFWCPKQKTYFKVDENNAHRLFKNKPFCPGYQENMEPARNQQSPTPHKFSCSDCATMMQTNNSFLDATQLWCSGCGHKMAHSRL
jgi:hypothetical protein